MHFLNINVAENLRLKLANWQKKPLVGVNPSPSFKRPNSSILSSRIFGVRPILDLSIKV